MRTSTINDGACSQKTRLESSMEPSENSIQARRQHPNISSGTVGLKFGDGDTGAR
jgi:hypothetical protein